MERHDLRDAYKCLRQRAGPRPGGLAWLVSTHGLYRHGGDAACYPGDAVPVTMRQDLTARQIAFPAIWLGTIGGPKNANSHSLAHPVGQVAGASHNRTPPLACP